MGNSRLAKLDKQITEEIEKLQTLRKRKCYTFFLPKTNITDIVVEDVFDDLRKDYCDCDGELDVVVFSGGGDIDAAYNLALLFRKFASKYLTFIVPRWAKSAATLLVCSGNKILMSPIAELGPLDPQITQVNPMEQRTEQFSPLHIEATLDLIREEFKQGHKDLANGLLERLQFPLTLGSFKKSLELSKEYLKRLLSTRMLIGDDKEKRCNEIAEKMAKGYPDHSFCVDIEEAKAIGLEVEELKDDELNIVWKIHKFIREKEKIRAEQHRKKMEELIKNLPPELKDASMKGIKKAKPKPANSHEDLTKE